MLYKLQPALYSQILPVFSAIDNQLVIRSVVAGNTPAWVYVDQLEEPQTALLWDMQDAMLLAGNPGNPALYNQIRAILIDQILPDARKRWVPDLTLAFTPSEWADHVEDILPGFEAVRVPRHSYWLDHLQIDWRTCLPTGFSVQQIDADLLQSDLDNTEDVRGWIDSFWHTSTNFLRNGFGFCAIQDETIASWCLTIFAADSERELALATDPRFRRQGLATAVAAASVEHALANGLTSHWHCMAENLPSNRVAEKVGFRKEQEYFVYQFSI